jgi:hypothetical protein
MLLQLCLAMVIASLAVFAPFSSSSWSNAFRVTRANTQRAPCRFPTFHPLSRATGARRPLQSFFGTFSTHIRGARRLHFPPLGIAGVLTSYFADHFLIHPTRTQNEGYSTVDFACFFVLHDRWTLVECEMRMWWVLVSCLLPVLHSHTTSS